MKNESLKISKYIIQKKVNDKWLIYNTLTRKKQYLNEKIEKYYNDFHNSKEREIVEELVLNGFIVNPEEELITLKDKRESVLNPTVLRLIIIPTMKCNFQCKYCYEKHSNTVMNEQIVNSIIMYVKKNIEKFSGVYISWFGGEPLLNMPIIRKISKSIALICTMYKKMFMSGITTNGYLLSDEVIDELLKYNFCHFQVTLDGPKETHDLSRPLIGGYSTFDKIKNNLLNLKKKENNFRLIIRINISKTNENKIIKFLDYLYELFGNDERIEILLKNVGRYSYNIENYNDYRDNTSLQDYIQYGRSIGLNMGRSLLFTGDSGFVCYASTNNTFLVDYDGKVKKCTVLLDDKINYYGRLDTNGELQKDLDYKEKVIDEKCLNCEIYPLCFGLSCIRKNNDEKCLKLRKIVFDSIELIN